jgi:hypothetical protein
MTTRVLAIADLRRRFARDGYPRLTMLVILTLAGAVAFFSSVGALRAGVGSMGLRYGLAVIAGYAAFLILIRGWIALSRGAWWPDSHVFDVVDVGGTAGALDMTPDLEPGRGASQAARAARRDEPSFLGRVVDGVTTSPGDDVLSFVVLAIFAALGALVAVVWVINAAPLLLAEVAIDAALVSALYRRLRQDDMAHWTSAVVRHTWVPTLVLFVCMSVAGFALQRIVPSAHSIGGVIRAFVE